MRGRGRGRGGGRRRRDDPDEAFRRFLASQRGELQTWARRRTQQIEEIGLSSDMEALVAELLEDLREEPVMLEEAAVAHGGTHALLMRACTELKFLKHHAQQAVGIVLAQEGGATLIQRPGLLSACLD